MSLYITDGPIAICDRCQQKMLRRELSPDRDKPSLLVCRYCNDIRDPWRLPFTPKDADIHVDRPRPEIALDVPTTETTVDDTGHVVEGQLTPPADRVTKVSSS